MTALSVARGNGGRPALSPELELAAACVAWPPTESRDARIRSTAAGPLDWPRFLRVIDRHGVIGLVNAGISRAGAGVPPDVVEAIEAEATAQAHANLALAVESIRLQRLLEAGGLQPLFIKGAALAIEAYGDLGLRSSKDIDVLVPRARLSEAIAIVTSAGYSQVDPPPDLGEERLELILPYRKDLGFVHAESELYVELHWRLFLNPYAMNEDSLVSRDVPLSGGGRLRALSGEDLFAYLCVHGALHCWNQLKWSGDVCALLSELPDAAVERYYRAAERRGAGRAAGQAMLLCQRLFDLPLPTSVGRQLARRRGLRWLEQAGLNMLGAGNGTEHPHSLRFGTTRGSVATLLLGTTWRYYRAELRNLLINESDVLAVPLPWWLRFLYPFLRLPLWIWRHLGHAST